MQKMNTDILRKEFEFIKNSERDGVFGIYVVDSGKTGPNLGITMCTHGNEPAGLAVLKNVRENREKLLCGKITFVLNNLQATEKYFTSTSDEEKINSRCLDVNMNRLPDSFIENVDDNRYEIIRSRELLNVWGQFDYALEIHSTSADAEPMVITMNEFAPEHIRNFPIHIIISNVMNVMTQKPACAFYKKNSPVYIIEAGQHEKMETFDNAVKVASRLLENLKMYSKTEGNDVVEYDEYYVTSSVFFPNQSYELSKIFEPFELVKKGQIIATGDQRDIVAEEDSHVLLAPPRKKMNDLNEEVLFFSKPVKKIQL